jgi:mannitol/fructose-specific phosphotransferase system IIA component (Ntr-type)
LWEKNKIVFATSHLPIHIGQMGNPKKKLKLLFSINPGNPNKNLGKLLLAVLG